MKVFFDAAVVFLCAFWFIVLMTSVMMFGAPGATNSQSNILFVIGILCYPIGIFLIYTLLGLPFFGMRSIYFLAGSTTFICLCLWMFGYLSLLSNSIDGIKNEGYTILTEKNKVYYNAKLIEGADAKSFQFDGIEGNDARIGYSLDKNAVYYQGKKINGSDPSSFHLVKQEGVPDYENGYFADSKAVYYNDIVVVHADPNNMQIWRFGRARSGNNYYVRGKRLSVDGETFQFLTSSYGKDKDHIYQDDHIILPEADPATFTISTENSEFATDKDNVYSLWFKDSYALEVDKNSFRESTGQDSSGYYQDKDHVYFMRPHGKVFFIVEKATPTTFETTRYNDKYGSDATDGKHYYQRGKLVKTVE